MPKSSRTVITIGNFDGVHRGHGRILARARQIADARGASVVAMAFDPHPATVLRPGTEPPRLLGRAQKISCLQEAGADSVVILTPTPQLLGQSPDQFVRDLVRTHRPVAFVEGPNFRFGHGRRGDVARLRELGKEHGFDMEVVEAVELALNDLLLVPVSSSLVRWLVALGRVADAARCLGRPYGLGGSVVHGDRRGRSLGVPTANLLAAPQEHVVPADGVYAGLVKVPEGTVHAAAISVGNRPTFPGTERLVESHVLDFTADLYGQRIEVRFCRWLRDQQPFPDAGSLKAQLSRDVARTRDLWNAGLLEQVAQSGPAAGFAAGGVESRKVQGSM